MNSLQTAHDLHQHIRDLLCSEHFGNNQPSKISSDCLLLLSRVRGIVFEYLDKCAQKQANMQLLYEHVNNNFCSQCQMFDVLQIENLAKVCNFFELVLTPIIEYYIREWNLLSQSIVLNNLVGESREEINECLCPSNNTVSQHCLNNSKFCYRCGELFHKVCFNIQVGEYYECPSCYLVYCMPQREVIDVIFKGYIPPVSQGESIMSIIEIQWPITRLALQGHAIQLRCFRIGHEYEITWPQTCEIYLDDDISVSFKPLPESSPLKRRHDCQIIVPIRDLSCSQKIKVHEHYSGVSSWHLLTVSLVRPRSQEQIFNSMYRNPEQIMNEQQSKAYLQRLFWKGNGLEMEQLKISDICQFYRQKIRYPCRSRHCLTHYQPFDLYSLICSSVTAKSSIKRWKCPICGARAYDVVRDLHLEKLMNQPGNGKDRSFTWRSNQKQFEK